MEEDRTIYIYCPDEIQGRIIGRDGRNVRRLKYFTDTTFEFNNRWWISITGHPSDVEMVRKAIREMLKDGRIHPARIEEVLREKCSSDEDREFLNNRIEMFNEGKRKANLYRKTF